MCLLHKSIQFEEQETKKPNLKSWSDRILIIFILYYIVDTVHMYNASGLLFEKISWPDHKNQPDLCAE